MSLRDEIKTKRNEIIVDNYSVSIGEIMNIYKENEMDVHPEFQRFFRWDDEQKTKLIESILLGIPIPPIFVSQRVNGVWDVIDGQQRLSTILQFMQVLKTDDGADYKPLVLKATKFLPSLENVKWDAEALFEEDQKITFKREKLSFTIIKETEDNSDSKYEMFQRLNTGGTNLSPQELRNCLLIMINRDLYLKIASLNEAPGFKVCFPLTETQTDERYDLELVVRYLLYTSFSREFLAGLDKSRNMDMFLTSELENMANDDTRPLEEAKERFARIFDLLEEELGEESFKRYKDGKFSGTVLLSAFESIIPGLYQNLEYWEENKDTLREKVIGIYETNQYIAASRRGIRSLDRMAQLIMFSREWFGDEN